MQQLTDGGDSLSLSTAASTFRIVSRSVRGSLSGVKRFLSSQSSATPYNFFDAILVRESGWVMGSATELIRTCEDTVESRWVVRAAEDHVIRIPPSINARKNG